MRLRRKSIKAQVDTGMLEIEASKRNMVIHPSEKELMLKKKNDKGEEVTQNRFFNPEVEFKRLIEANKEINKGMKEGKRDLMDNVQRKGMDDSFEQFSKAFHTPRRLMSPPCKSSQMVD